MSKNDNNQIQPYEAAIEKAQQQFLELASRVSGLSFEKEAMFATQAMINNSFLAQVANKNPNSARMAVINVAAVGLTLNPAQGLAFLVPRDGRVLLDISYRGLIRIASEEGAIQAAKADLVYDKDHFLYRGPFQEPVHECDPFSEKRGAVRGVYCVARLPDGGVLTETMSESDIQAVMQTSESAKRGKGPWVTFPGEMRKKAVTKRAAKWWQSGGKERLAEAERILNEDNGEGFAPVDSRNAPRVFDHQPEPTPDVADLSQVSEQTKAKVAELCRRASAAGQWAAAEEYAEDRFTGNDLAYARAELQRSSDEQPEPASTVDEDQSPE